MRIRLGILLFSTVTATAVLVPAIPAAAAMLHCGSIVTANVTLTSDLTCAGTALKVIASPNPVVTIDLNGHKLRGNGTGNAVEVDGPAPGKTVLSVTNGTISGFLNAFAVGYDQYQVAPALTVDHVVVRGNGTWLYNFRFFTFSSATFSNDTIVDSGNGGTHDSGSLLVRNSTLVRSNVNSGPESNIRLTDNVFLGAGAAIGLNAFVSVTGNSFMGCDLGLSVVDFVSGPRSVIQDNSFTGCRVGADVGDPVNDVLIAHNLFIGNSDVGLRFHAASFATAHISTNRFLVNGEDGLTGTGPRGVVVNGNVAAGNGGHGIIVSGVADGGANVAYGNHLAPDCVGVVCLAR